MKQTTKPKELDLNITQMRIDAMSDLLATLHEKMKRFDDIDVLERVLNQQTPAIARRALQGASGNGSNGHQYDVHNEPEDREPKPKVKRRQLPHHKNPAMVEAALRVLEAAPAGLTVYDIAAKMRDAGAISPLLNDQQAYVVAYRALATAQKAKRLRSELPSHGEAAGGKKGVYFSLGAPVAAQPPASPAAAISQDLSVRDAVVQCMLTWPINAQVRPVEISDKLIASGWPKMRKNNPLNNHVNWAMSTLITRGIAVRKDKGKFPAYVLKRPVINVTKEA